MTTGERMKQRRKDIGLSAERVAEMLGVSPATIYRYENGDIDKVPGSRLAPIAEALMTTPAFLMGWADEQSGTASKFPENSNIFPLPAMKEWPVLGAAACGEPIHRELEHETVLAPADVKADFVFRCVGDSMINARIFDGDTVFVRFCDVQDGDIAVVRVGDEYTLKRVYRGPDYLELRAENPTYPTKIVRGEQEDAEIIGKAVYFLSQVV